MIFKDEWPCAIAKDIEKTVVEPTEPTLQYIQRILNNSHAWQLLMKGLGYPEIVSGSFYSYYPSEKLLRESTSLFEKSSALLGGMAVFNNMCLKTMYYYLQQNIKEVNKGYTSDELIERIGVKADFVPIIHRWLHVLNSNSYIRNEEKEYYFEKKMHYSELEKIWVDGKNVWENANLGTISTYEYFKNNALKLNYIMKGELNPTLLLFPEGQMYVADDLYSKTPISSYYNQMISDYVKSECELREGCRLLELGGGTASTAKPIIEKIKFLSVEEYFFSDISDFFVNRAKELFSGIRFIEYLKIDINNDFVSDKIKEDSVDIVIAVGVLNNAKNIEVTLKNIKKVLKKDGKVIIVEAIGESVQMLISQAFMMQEPDDARAEKNETFLKLYQWHELFQKVGFAVEKSLPTIDSELCVYNQKVFVLSCQLEDKYSGSK